MDIQPPEQRLVALEQLLERVDEEALAEPPGTRQEVMLPSTAELLDVGGLVDVIVSAACESSAFPWAACGASSVAIPCTARQPRPANPRNCSSGPLSAQCLRLHAALVHLRIARRPPSLDCCPPADECRPCLASPGLVMGVGTETRPVTAAARGALAAVERQASGDRSRCPTAPEQGPPNGVCSARETPRCVLPEIRPRSCCAVPRGRSRD